MNENDPGLEIIPKESDQDVLAKKPSKVRLAHNALNVGVFSGAGLAVLGFAAYGFVKFAQDRDSAEQYYSYQPKNERPLERLEERISASEKNPPSSEEVKRYLIANYYLGKAGLEAFSDFELKTGDSDEIKKTIAQKRIKLALLGAEILAIQEPSKNILVDEQKGEVTFEGRYFDIKNPRHLFILDEVIEQNVFLIDPNKKPQEKYKASKWIEDLNWLADSNVPVQFEESEIGYPPYGSLRALARFYRTLDSLGIVDLPSKIDYVPHLIDEKLGYAGGIYDDGVEEIQISKSSGADTPVHEEAHHLAYRDKDYSQQKFNEVVDEAKREFQIIIDPKNVFISPYVLDSAMNGISTTEFEDYAETINKYFWDGVAFRRRVAELKYTNSDAAYILAAKYEFAKRLFGGKEFTKEGEVFAVEIGDVFSISDPDPAKLVIPLRQEPKEITVQTDFVSDTNSVKILEGPVVTTYKGEEVKMWKVEGGDISPQGEFGPTDNMKQGWISETWFGDKILAKGAEDFIGK